MFVIRNNRQTITSTIVHMDCLKSPASLLVCQDHPEEEVHQTEDETRERTEKIKRAKARAR